MALSRPLMDDDHRALPLSTFSFSRRSIEYVMSFAFCLQLLGKGGRGGGVVLPVVCLDMLASS